MFAQVLEISLPVFLVIALGALLRRVGLIGEAAQGFLSRFPYLICLPILVFVQVAGKDFADLLNAGIITSMCLGTLLAAGLLWLASRRLRPSLRGGLILSGFFANSAYLGFPLSQSAFGADGLFYAGIANAFGMPLFVVLGTVCMHTGSARRDSAMHALRAGLGNPIVLAAFGGVAFALVAHPTGLSEAWMGVAPLRSATDIVLRAANMVGRMGLPLALLAIGASLRLGHVREHLTWALVGSAAKLVLAPALTLGILWLLVGRVLGPRDPAARGVAVLIMACPLSVSSWIISKPTPADSDYIGALLLVSTAAACVTIPAWLLILLG
jgi:predicted permease